MLDNGGGNIKLEQTEFVDMGPLSRYYSFKRDAHTGKKKRRRSTKNEWLFEAFTKRWLDRCTISLDLVLMRRFLSLREIAMVE